MSFLFSVTCKYWMVIGFFWGRFLVQQDSKPGLCGIPRNTQSCHMFPLLRTWIDEDETSSKFWNDSSISWIVVVWKWISYIWRSTWSCCIVISPTKTYVDYYTAHHPVQNIHSLVSRSPDLVQYFGWKSSHDALCTIVSWYLLPGIPSSYLFFICQANSLFASFCWFFGTTYSSVALWPGLGDDL